MDVTYVTNTCTIQRYKVAVRVLVCILSETRAGFLEVQSYKVRRLLYTSMKAFEWVW